MIYIDPVNPTTGTKASSDPNIVSREARVEISVRQPILEIKVRLVRVVFEEPNYSSLTTEVQTGYLSNIVQKKEKKERERIIKSNNDKSRVDLPAKYTFLDGILLHGLLQGKMR